MHSKQVLLTLAVATTSVSATPILSLFKRQETMAPTNYTPGSNGITCNYDQAIAGGAGGIHVDARGTLENMGQDFIVNNNGVGCTVMYKQETGTDDIRVSLCTTDATIPVGTAVSDTDAVSALDRFTAACDPGKTQKFLGGVSLIKPGLELLFDRADM
ncbi:MAG: hypothetical protein M1831_006853 [Alyxoria varia]|nr:MAG: hypothetical protein M1831_006853 [Alyxoria varia]